MHQKTTTGRDYLAVGGTAPATMCNHPQAAGLPLQWRGTAGFTLAELVISVGILVVLVLLFTCSLTARRLLPRLATNKWTPTHRHDSSLIEWPSISHSW